MKNSRLFPFERNRYFYGKLLTVRDFETEQRYFNDKRRLLNKLVTGSGIVSGLQVVAIDDKTLSIESGIAIDNLGREIVVPSPITQKLSLIEGFPDNECANNVYLCLAYDEKGKEPVHSVSNSSEGSGDVNEYNRFNECYKIFVKEEDTGSSVSGSSGLVENTTLIYNDNKIKIWQITPKYVSANGKFDIIIKVEKVLQVSSIEFSYELCLKNITGMDGKDNLKVSFIESEYDSSSQYKLKYTVRAQDTKGQSGKVSMNEGSFHIKIGDKQFNASAELTNEIKIIPGSVKEEIVKDYFSQSLDECMQNNADAYIQLAKISLIQVGPVFVIDKVMPVPFDEYIYNIPLLNKLIMANDNNDNNVFSAKASAVYTSNREQPAVKVDFNDNKNEFDFRFEIPKHKNVSKDLSTGIAEFNGGGKFKVSKSYFSEEIEHGLGEGPVAIILGLEEQDDEVYTKIQQVNERIFYGNYDIFEKSPYEATEPQVSMASVVYPKKGTFRIGIRFEDTFNETKIAIRWWAYKISNSKQDE